PSPARSPRPWPPGPPARPAPTRCSRWLPSRGDARWVRARDGFRPGRTMPEPAAAPRRRGRRSHVQVAHELRVLFDESAPRLHLIPHQRLEQLRGLHRVFHRDLEERALRRVHGGVPELIGVHLAESLVALDHDVAVWLGPVRSEERRVGKECRSRWSPYEQKKQWMDTEYVALSHGS